MKSLLPALGVIFGIGWLLQIGSRLARDTEQLGVASLLLILTALLPGVVGAWMLVRTHQAQWRRLWEWRIGMRWYLAAVAVGAMPWLSAFAVAHWFGLAFTVNPAAFVLLPLLLVLAFAEEIGWRGWLLPAFLQQMTPFRASVLVGVLWGVWHSIDYLRLPLPLWSAMWLTFVCLAVAQSLIFTWMFLANNQRLLPIAVTHAVGNGLAGSIVFSYQPEVVAVHLLVRILVLCSTLMITVLIWRRSMINKRIGVAAL